VATSAIIAGAARKRRMTSQSISTPNSPITSIATMIARINVSVPPPGARLTVMAWITAKAMNGAAIDTSP